MHYVYMYCTYKYYVWILCKNTVNIYRRMNIVLYLDIVYTYCIYIVCVLLYAHSLISSVGRAHDS